MSFYDPVYRVVTSEQAYEQPACNEYDPVSPVFREQRPFAV
jgi:hypothetical protein